MFKFTKALTLTIFTICHFGHAFAMLEHDPDDLQRSKSHFLVSGERYEELFAQRRGVMTLCFEKENKKAAMVFEFVPRGSIELSLLMAYAGSEDLCCGSPKRESVVINDAQDTLKKVYRALKVSVASAHKERSVPIYTRYASWIIPNDRLATAVTYIEKDRTQEESFTNTDYIRKIMNYAGLENVEANDDLKILASSYVLPRPDRLEGHFSPLP